MDKKGINQTDLNNIPNFEYDDKPEEFMPSLDQIKQSLNSQLNQEISNSNNNQSNNNPEMEKELLIKELSENFNIGYINRECNANEENPKLDNKSLTIIQEEFNESKSAFSFPPKNEKKEEYDKEKIEESIIPKEFDGQNDLMSFYGGNNDIENLVNSLKFNMKQDISILVEDYLEVIQFNKINNEQINQIKQTVNQNDLQDCKNAMEKVDYDGKIISKISDIDYLLVKAKEIDNKNIDDLKKKFTEKENYLYAWRDILPGSDSFFRAIIFSFLEEIILSRNINNYQAFLYEFHKNMEDNYFKKLLSIYSIDSLKPKICLILIYYALTIQDIEASIAKAHSLLIKIYNFDSNFDLFLILNLKFLIYKYIKNNERKLYTKEYSVQMGSFLPQRYQVGNNYNFKDFYDNDLLQLYKEPAKISISVIPFILRRDLFIYSFEQNKLNNIWVHTDNKENKDFLPFRIILLNGSYEILYQKDYYNQFQKIFSKFSSVTTNKINKNISNDNIVPEKILGNIEDDNAPNNLENNNSNNDLNNKRISVNLENKINNDNYNMISQSKNKSQDNYEYGNNINNLENNNFNNNNNFSNNNINCNSKVSINNSSNKNIGNNYNTSINNNINSNANINATPNINNFNNNMNINNNNNYNTINNNPSIKNNNNYNNNINNYNSNNNNYNSNNNNYNSNNNNYNSNNNNYNSNNNINNYNRNKNDIFINNKNNYNTPNLYNMTNYNQNFNMKNKFTSYNNNININNFNSNNNQKSQRVINQNNINNIQNSKKDALETFLETPSQQKNNFNGPKGAPPIKLQNNNAFMSPRNNPFIERNNGGVSLNKECPLCKKPGKDNFYCSNCLLNILVVFVQNNYIQFIKNNIKNLIKDRPKENLNDFLKNLKIVFPNKTTKPFNESFFLLSDYNKNVFNDKLTNFKSSLCLGCFKIVNKENNFVSYNEKGSASSNVFLFRFPCGCIFCSKDCLNRFINAVPLFKINSFVCGCGTQYDYIQLKFLLYFALSHNLMKFKDEILRYMYETIKNKCCKCKSEIKLINEKKNNVNIMEVNDKEAEKIFGIYKFNHLICDKCVKTKEISKNKYFCSLCSSEHLIISKKNIKNCQIRNTCSIF